MAMGDFAGRPIQGPDAASSTKRSGTRGTTTTPRNRPRRLQRPSADAVLRRRPDGPGGAERGGEGVPPRHPGVPRLARARARRGRPGRLPRADRRQAGGRALRLPADRPADARLGRELLPDGGRQDHRALGPVRRADDDAAARSRSRAADTPEAPEEAPAYGDPHRAGTRGLANIEANKAVYRRMVEEVVNQGKFEVVDEIFHPDYVDHVAPPGTHAGARRRQGDLHRCSGRASRT